jgi:YHS domain-containing protein
MKRLLATALIILAATGFAADNPYPLDTCIVSGNKLGSMGKVVVKSYEGREIKFCCKPCVKKFDANPAKYLSKLKK